MMTGRQEKFRLPALTAFPTLVDENLRDSCKAFEDKRCTDTAARQYWVGAEAGKRNHVVVHHKNSKFYVFVSDPQEEVNEEQAHRFV